jgi:hypothetical protein
MQRSKKNRYSITSSARNNIDCGTVDLSHLRTLFCVVLIAPVLVPANAKTSGDGHLIVRLRITFTSTLFAYGK